MHIGLYTGLCDYSPCFNNLTHRRSIIMSIRSITARFCKTFAEWFNGVSARLEKPSSQMTESERSALQSRLSMLLRYRDPDFDVKIRKDQILLEVSILIAMIVLGAIVVVGFWLFPSLLDFFVKYSLLICFSLGLILLCILLFGIIKKSRGSKRLATRPSAEIRLFTRGDTKK